MRCSDLAVLGLSHSGVAAAAGGVWRVACCAWRVSRRSCGAALFSWRVSRRSCGAALFGKSFTGINVLIHRADCRRVRGLNSFLSFETGSAESRCAPNKTLLGVRQVRQGHRSALVCMRVRVHACGPLTVAARMLSEVPLQELEPASLARAQGRSKRRSCANTAPWRGGGTWSSPHPPRGGEVPGTGPWCSSP